MFTLTAPSNSPHCSTQRYVHCVHRKSARSRIRCVVAQWHDVGGAQHGNHSQFPNYKLKIYSLNKATILPVPDACWYMYQHRLVVHTKEATVCCRQQVLGAHTLGSSPCKHRHGKTGLLQECDTRSLKSQRSSPAAMRKSDAATNTI
jgi:hypothetical protein